MRLENKLKQQKEQRLMFTKALMKYLEQNDSGLHTRAKTLRMNVWKGMITKNQNI